MNKQTQITERTITSRKHFLEVTHYQERSKIDPSSMLSNSTPWSGRELVLLINFWFEERCRGFFWSEESIAAKFKRSSPFSPGRVIDKLFRNYGYFKKVNSILRKPGMRLRRDRRPWNERELQAIKQYLANKEIWVSKWSRNANMRDPRAKNPPLTIEELSLLLGRSPRSVEDKIKKLGKVETKGLGLL